MHLTIVSPFPPAITGIGQYGYHMTRTLAQSGSFARLTVLAGASEPIQPTGDLETVDVDYCWSPGDYATRRHLLGKLQDLRPDLVWFNLGSSVFGRSALVNLSGWLTPLWTQRLGFPTVITLHELPETADLRALNAPGGPLAPLGARLLTEIATRADVVCLTMRHYVETLRARQIDCAYIPIGAYHEPDLLEESPNQNLLFFTTLAPFKGLETLLAAFETLRQRFPCLTLTIAGTEHIRFPNYGQALKEQYHQTEGIRWLGQVDEDQVKGLFQQAQIVVLPYLASTGSSSVLYQAATWGRPIVASDLPEICALIRDNNLKINCFERGNAASLVEALITLLTMPRQRAQQASHNFSAIQTTRPKATCNRYIEVFNRAIQKRGSLRRIRVPTETLELG